MIFIHLYYIIFVIEKNIKDKWKKTLFEKAFIEQNACNLKI